ncbi:amino acid/amide ABC transporter substrate-binding protein (HAAT family) [Chelatococcus asaccharovorans]|uniref:Amino acid/amide ABC transporter substrate-binding protein (HAAT family) n=2 Tax=Chelatococcus asaccharovorans TaxID=28210 RepID=A0A2V3UK84_9HYPH|nr:amino acid/amide ABC transporter substrate-binding protein (HAAT family) [Chelatococcus asaccharovorans]
MQRTIVPMFIETQETIRGNDKMQVNRRQALIGAAAAVGVTTLAGGRARAAEPIRIGAILPLSGTAELVGNKQKLGIEIARDQINAAGGVLGRPLEIVFRDDKGDPNVTVAAARELTSSGVNLIIGASLSALNIALIGVIQSLNGVMMTPSSPLDPLTHELFNRNFFRLADNNFMRCRGLARVMAERFPDVTVWGGLISDFSVGHDSWKEFTAGLREFYPRYAKRDVTILDVTTAKFGTTDYKTQIFRVLQSPAQGVLNVTIGADMITLWKQAKTLGLSDKLQVVADAGGELDLPVILGKDMPKQLWSNLHWFFGNPNGNAVNKALVAEIEKRTGDKNPSSLIGPAHGAVLAYAAAITLANGTATPAIIEALEKVKVETAKGTIIFRPEDHQQIGPVNILGSVPTPTGHQFKDYVEVPGAEIVEPATPGVPIKL